MNKEELLKQKEELRDKLFAVEDELEALELRQDAFVNFDETVYIIKRKYGYKLKVRAVDVASDVIRLEDLVFCHDKETFSKELLNLIRCLTEAAVEFSKQKK